MKKHLNDSNDLKHGRGLWTAAAIIGLLFAICTGDDSTGAAWLRLSGIAIFGIGAHFAGWMNDPNEKKCKK